jgi:hypothetical protein
MRYQLSDFLAKCVSLGTPRRLGQLRSRAGLLGCKLIFKGMRRGSAALVHGKSLQLTGPNRRVQREMLRQNIEAAFFI